MILIILNIFINSILAHAEFPYETLDDSYNLNGVKASFEVSNISPTKSQDGIGLCYGFAATTLLENYRCRELQLNCQEKGQLISPIDVSSYYLNRTQKSIQEAGNTSKLLNNLKTSARKLVKEDCANYSSLVHKSSPQFVPDEGQGWRYLVSAWNSFKVQSASVQKEMVSCVSRTIKGKISGLTTPSEQIQDALLNATSLENFLYRTILPTQCLNEQNLISVPDFQVNTYPRYGEKIDIKKLSEKIENILLNDIPLELSICTEEVAQGKCPEDLSHAITLSGVREACSSEGNECRTQVKVKNSYGHGWERNHNNGWIDLSTLATASLSNDSWGNITWLQKPGTTIKNKTLDRAGNINYYRTQISKPDNSIVNSIKGIPDKWKSYKGIWKCGGSTFIDHFEPGCIPLSFK